MRIFKSSLAIIVSVTMLLITSCGFFGDTINRITHNPEEAFKRAVDNGNVELFRELCAEYPDFDLDSISASGGLIVNLLYTTKYSKETAFEMADVAIANGADLDILTHGSAYLYNSVDDMISVDNLRYCVDKGIVLKDVDNDILGNLLECCIKNYAGDVRDYIVIDYLLDQGVRCRREFFEQSQLFDDKYYYLTKSPKATQLVMSKYIEEGGELDYPDYIIYAFAGDIEKALDSINQSEVSEEDYNVLFAFTTAFGTVEQYERLLEIYGQERHLNLNSVFSLTVSCNNAEMLEYFIDDIIENDKEDGSLCMLYSREIDIAAYYQYYDIFDILIESGFDFSIYDGTPHYLFLGYCIESEGYDIEHFVKLYSYIENMYYPISEEGIHYLFRNRNIKNLDNVKPYIDFFMDDKGLKLHQVCVSDVSIEIAKYLYEKGRPLQAYDLSDALDSQDLNLVKLVHSQGADLNQNYYSYQDGSQWVNTFSTEKYPSYNEQLLDDSYQSDNPRSSNFKAFRGGYYSEIMKYLIDNGMIIPDDALVLSINASKATVQVLLDAGASTNVEIPEQYKGGFLPENKEYSLKDVYEQEGRYDLIDLL